MKIISLTEKAEKHDELNPKLFDGKQLKPEVKEKVLKIVEEFKTYLKQDNIDIDIADIVLVGSNVSYTFTDKSDLDVHIRVDLSNYGSEEQQNILKVLYDNYRKLWNSKYEIKFYDIPVELFIETKFNIDEEYKML